MQISSRNPKCAILAMQKDEGQLLYSWVSYHSSLIGAENIYLFDNLSSDCLTVECLRWAESLGVNVIWGAREFEQKGILISALISELGSRYDWYFPLDADEFIGCRSTNGASSSLDSIILGLKKHTGEKILRMNEYFWGIPFSTGSYHTPAKKVIVPGGMQVKLDIGFHLYDWGTGDTVPTETLDDTSIIYIHFHNKPFPRVLDASRLKLAARVPSFTRDVLTAYRGAGRHLVRYFMMSELDYMESFPPSILDLTDFFREHGLLVPFSPQWGDEISMKIIKGQGDADAV